MLGLLGDEWSLLIIQQAVMGATRYSHFMTRLPISNAVLSSRLRSLVGEGLLVRCDGGYLPTARSRSLWPLLVLIWEWERTWVPDHADRLPAMRHDRCGELFRPVLRCACCQRPAGSAHVDLAFGPSGTWQRCAPASATRRRADPQSGAGQAGLFAETMTVLGNRWAAALLVAAFLGADRFTDFQSQLGAPPSLLAGRLQTFCDIGVLRWDAHCGGERGTYLLTDKGRAFFPVLATAVKWAQRWFVSPDGPAVVMTHRECDAQFSGELACGRCGDRLTGARVTVTQAAVSGIP
jgi:DNA-binding HxlR family transcriptional regulator